MRDVTASAARSTSDTHDHTIGAGGGVHAKCP
jgi:hypothetical protein